MKNLVTLIAVALSISASAQITAVQQRALNDLFSDTTIHGNVKSVTHTELDRRKRWASGYSFHVTYNENGDWTSVKMKGETEYVLRTRTLNADGHMNSITDFTSDGDTAMHTTYDYGEHGITREVIKDYSDNRFEGFGFNYTYENGKLIGKRGFILHSGRESKTSEKYTYEYNEEDKLVLIHHDLSRSITDTTFYGDTLVKVFKKGNRHVLYSYRDDKGRIDHETNHRLTYPDDDSEPEEKLTSEVKYSYNDKGHVVAITRDNHGFPDYNDRIVYEYDQHGNMISREEYGQHEDGAEVKEVHWTRKIEYYD